MELNEWVAHPAPLKLFGDKYREDGDEKGLCRASPAVALALYKASLSKMPEEDRWQGSDEVDAVRLAIAECLEEFGDYERALEEARVTLRGRPLEEVDTRLSALLARLSQEALPPDAPEAVEYRRVASIKSVAARKIQLRHKRFAVAKEKWAATMVQARWRGLRAFRKQKEWQEFLRGSLRRGPHGRSGRRIFEGAAPVHRRARDDDAESAGAGHREAEERTRSDEAVPRDGGGS